MHANNKLFLAEVKEKYPTNFNRAKVLELGSAGSSNKIRDYFEQCDYTGVDILSEPTVDVVCAAKDTKFEPETFDTLICFSMFEHDPEWKYSLEHNLPALKKGGMLFLCWGAEDNPHHSPDPHKPVPHMEVLDFLQAQGFTIIDRFFEEEKYGPDCPGAFDVVAVKQ